ncbi:MAG: hypothetical protein ABWJ97_04790 [Thermoproteus sp.]
MSTNDLFEFYRSLDTSLRLLIRFKLSHVVGKTFEELAEQEPWSLYPALVKALGEHNAEVLLNMLSDWLMKNGERVDVNILRDRLSRREAWSEAEA